MWKRTMLAVLAGGLLVSGNLAPASAGTSALSSSAVPANPGQTSSVTLPTGDRVLVRSDRTMTFRPAPGREHIGYFSPSVTDADTVVIPADVVDDVAERSLDPRLFNVSALLRSGHTDAREVSPGQVDNREYGVLLPAARPPDAGAPQVPVTISVRGRDGEVADEAFVMVLNLESGYFTDAWASAGRVTTLRLPRGRYAVYTAILTGSTEAAGGEMVNVVDRITVDDVPVMLTTDGSRARPVTAAVDRADAVLNQHELAVALVGNPWTYTAVLGLGGRDRAYATPTPEFTDGSVLMAYRPIFTSPGGAAAEHPYRYHLVFPELNGIPEDPHYAVADSELAMREVEYQSLGGEPADGLAMSKASVDAIATLWTPEVPIRVPSTTTEYYTADPEIGWSHMRTIGVWGDDLENPGPVVSVYQVPSRQPMRPGQGRWSWNHAPLSVSLGPESEVLGLARYDGGGEPGIAGPVLLFSGATPGEYMRSYPVSGSVVLSRDGVELGRSDNPGFVSFPLPEGDAGRYTLTVDGSRSVSWAPLGIRSTVRWEFDSVPNDPSVPANQGVPLNIGVVRFDAAGVVNGYAPAGQDQAVTLRYENQPETPDATATDMTFEVSYDDGDTWTPVAIERDGDTATAVLHHPEGAEFVSVRMSATDDAGARVEHSTIRSYGLR